MSIKEHLADLEGRIVAARAMAFSDCVRIRQRSEAEQSDRWMRFHNEVALLEREREAVIKTLTDAEGLKAPPFVVTPTK